MRDGQYRKRGKKQVRDPRGGPAAMGKEFIAQLDVQDRCIQAICAD
jgi:hypothetical protein